MKKVVITGSAGFIGFHTSKKFLENGWKVIGIDSINDYYDPKIKVDRNKLLLDDVSGNYSFAKIDISDRKVRDILSDSSPDLIVNLAAQAGVRHSIEHPEDYLKSNIDGFLNILEFVRTSKKIDRVIYASTSSVYGGNLRSPFSETHPVDHPLQFYAVTKKTNELMAHAYSNLYGISCIGLRFFTVYGPWGRPDMALFKFTKNIIEGKKIDVYNNGNHSRDFTYVEDIAQGIFLASISKKNIKVSDFDSLDPSVSFCNSRIFNLGRGRPESLEDFISEIEVNVGKNAIKNYLPLQMGDVPHTSADIESLVNFSGYSPKTSIKEGVKNFVDWYLDYYNIEK